MFIDKKHNHLELMPLQQKIAHEDQAAFTIIYHHFNKKLIAFAQSLVHSKDIAEDVVEDVFIKLWANRFSITQIENLSVYLYVSVKNGSLNKISEKARQLITQPFDGIEPQVEDLTDNPYNILLNAELLKRMNLAINDLPPRCKMIFKLVREDGLKYKEVSQILNISVNTIDVQMAIAIKRICKAMGIGKKPSQNIFSSLSKKNKKL
ncbi:MAG: RNA polymerase sigma-70 factor [Niabella sp.]